MKSNFHRLFQTGKKVKLIRIVVKFEKISCWFNFEGKIKSISGFQLNYTKSASLIT